MKNPHSARRGFYRATWRQVSKTEHPSSYALLETKKSPLSLLLHNNRILTYEEFKNNPIL
jgi:hypothetical protein